jgi:hypothetical protein
MRLAKILVLEDDPTRLQGFVIGLKGMDYTLVSNPIMAVGYLALYDWDVLFLDHDLGGNAFCPSDEKSGFAVACWLSENPTHVPGKIVIHSWNPAGVENMQAVLQAYNVYVEQYKDAQRVRELVG